MKNATLLQLISAILILCCSVQADVPGMISYQGRITDSNGDPVTQNDLSVRFIMYTDSAGGSIVWSTITQKDVVDGLYQHNLGSITSFSDTLFTAFPELWLEVLVDGEVVDPRTRIVSAPYAIHANTVQSVNAAEAGVIEMDQTFQEPLVVHSQSIGSSQPRELLRLFHENTVQADLGDGFSARIGFSVGTTDEGEIELARIEAERKDSDNSGALLFRTIESGTFANGSKFYISPYGEFGLNTDEPDEVLHVVGYTAASAQSRQLLILNHRRTGASSLSDGFACGIDFSLGHDSDPVINIAAINAVRDGLDNAGRLDFIVRDGGFYHTALSIKPNGRVGIGTTSPSQNLAVSGNICYTGSIGACSDRRYKTNVIGLSGSLEKTLKLRGVTFNWKRDEFPSKKFDDRTHLGFIAQEVETLFPEMVMTDENGFKSVDYSRLTPVLVEAIKELRAEKDEEIAELKSQIDGLRQMVSDIAAQTGNASPVYGNK